MDGVKVNNDVRNLEYCTRSENSLHSYRSGLMRSGEGKFNAKRTNNDVLGIRALHGHVRMLELAATYGVDHKVTVGIQQRRMWKHVPEGDPQYQALRPAA